MSYLLDTNVCIEQLRGRATSQLTRRLASVNSDEVALCSVVIAELLYGAAKSTRAIHNLAEVRRFCGQFVSIPFDDRAAGEYGPLRAHLETIGRSIGPNDLLIASIALAHNLTLVTRNITEFSHVPRLRSEDWQGS